MCVLIIYLSNVEIIFLLLTLKKNILLFVVIKPQKIRYTGICCFIVKIAYKIKWKKIYSKWNKNKFSTLYMRTKFEREQLREDIEMIEFY